MTTLRLGPVIGTLGGSKIETVEVDVAASGSSGSSEVIFEAEVPDGETWLVAVEGTLSVNSSSSSNRPALGFPGRSSTDVSGPVGRSIVTTETTRLELLRRSGIGQDRFVGTVYVVKL